MARYDATNYGATYRRYAEFFDAQVKQSWPAEKLARLVHDALTVTKPKPHHFFGPPGRFAIWMMSHLPARMQSVASARRFGVMPARRKQSAD